MLSWALFLGSLSILDGGRSVGKGLESGMTSFERSDLCGPTLNVG